MTCRRMTLLLLVGTSLLTTASDAYPECTPSPGTSHAEVPAETAMENCSAVCTQTTLLGLRKYQRNNAYCYCSDTHVEIPDTRCSEECGPIGDRYPCGGPGLMSVFTVCFPGLYETSCGTSCPDMPNCEENLCHRTTGACFSGCVDGWYGDVCNLPCPTNCAAGCDTHTGVCEPPACDPGWYGDSCNLPCPTNCAAGCDIYTGVCEPPACDPGWYGDFCTEPCPTYCAVGCEISTGVCDSRGCVPGYYGDYCYSDCTNCASECEINTGVCDDPQACDPGYHGDYCNDPCPTNCATAECEFQNGYCTGCLDIYWGSSCNQSCPQGCLNGACGQYTGDCTHGCTPGHWGDMCEDCPPNCKDDVCDMDNGICTNGCKDGHWGYRCKSDCPNNCPGLTCHQDTGDCRCADGEWGQNCDQQCPSNCTDNVCDQVTGNCTTGCESGWYDNWCTKRCQTGCEGSICDFEEGKCFSCSQTFYGDFCNETCPKNCAGDVCDFSSGLCTECHVGFHSSQCNESCPYNCLDDVCMISDGNCTHGCETGWEGVQCVTALDDTNVGAIVGICIALLVVIAGLVVLIIFLVRIRPRIKNKGPSPPFKTHNEYENIDVEFLAPVEMPPEPQKGPPDGQSDSTAAEIMQERSVKIDNFATYFRDKMDRKDFFKIEYKDLPTDTLYEWTAATRPEVKAKNRYVDIYPYDHNRVLLDEIEGEPGSDYINASRVQGYHAAEKAIACLGPRKNTVNDFWRMIWKENTTLIVILTNLIEAGVEKCHQYWPGAGCGQYGDIAVTLISEDMWPAYVLRKFIVAKGAEKHFVTQYHYTAWPDHGVPSDATAMLNFRRKVLIATRAKVPAVMHCSAGVGRTGTVMALDYLIKQSEAEGKVDVFDCVYNLRHQRKHTIQTLEQYVFLHEALAQYFTMGSPTIATSEYQQKYRDLIQAHPKGDIANKYRMLQQLAPERKKEDQDYALSPGNVVKNRNKLIIPMLHSRVILRSRVDNRNDYINAVSVNSYQRKIGFHVTNFPLANTVIDFWRMMWDHDSNTIIMLLNPNHNTEVQNFLPTEDKPLEVLDKVASVQSAQTHTSFNTTDIQMADKTGDASSPRTLLRVYMITVPEGSERINYKSALDVFTDLQRWKQQSGNKVITVICPDGATYSGQFVACSNLFEMINSEQEVDAFQVCKYVRDSRPEFIGSLNQFRGLYDAVDLYLKQFDMYSNFR